MNSVPLGEVCNIKTGKLDVNVGSEKGAFPFFTCAETPSRISFYDYDCECVLIAGNGEFGVNYYNGKFNAYQRTYIVTAKERKQTELHIPYLFLILQKSIQRLKNQSQGSIIQYLRLPQLEALEIPCPSLAEQKRIGAILERADRLRRTRRYALALSDSILPAAFLQLFGDPVTNPRHFCVAKLVDFLAFVTSGSRGWAEYYAPEGDRFIRSLDVRMNSISEEAAVFVSPPKGTETERTRVKAGDVLLTITGSRIGRVAPVPERLDGAFVSQHVAILRLEPGLLPVFLSMFLSLEAGGQRDIARLQYGQTKPGLNFDQIREFRIFVPPLSLQEEFAAVVTRAERLTVVQRESLRQAEHLFQSLLDGAFTTGI